MIFGTVLPDVVGCKVSMSQGIQSLDHELAREFGGGENVEAGLETLVSWTRRRLFCGARIFAGGGGGA